jgi:hypothetical protein
MDAAGRVDATVADVVEAGGVDATSADVVEAGNPLDARSEADSPVLTEAGREGGPAEGGVDSGTSAESGIDASDSGGCVTPPKGAPCDPGVVQCGGSACSVSGGRSTNVCCEPQVDAGTLAVCENNSPDAAGCSGLPLGCDEAADCDSGVCCFFELPWAGAFGNTYCSPYWPCAYHQGGWLICKTDADCQPQAAVEPDTKCVPESCVLSGAQVELGFCVRGLSPPFYTCTPK